jgi:hypothetical protein
MSYPIRTCVVCGEEFELKPGKPGYANRCPDCSQTENDTSDDAPEKGNSELNAERRRAMKDLLYRKES